MITISFIVPVYNMEQYVIKCLDSIVNQTRKDFEIIVINDGSKDDSERIIGEYAKKHSQHITVISQENHGIGYTRNKGIELARGKYITFIDSDDAIEPDFCEKMIGEMESRGLDLVVSDYYETYETSKNKSYFKIAEFDDTNLIDSPKLLFDINTSPWNKIYKVDLLRQYNIVFPEKKKYEDVIFVVKYLCVAKRVGKINLPLVDYLIRGGGETTTMNPKIFDIFDILDELFQYFVSNEIYENVKEYFEWFCINRITVYCIQQQYQRSDDVAMNFIQTGFAYLNETFPHWRANKHYVNNNSFLKRLLKGNEKNMKAFVKFARKRHKL